MSQNRSNTMNSINSVRSIGPSAPNQTETIIQCLKDQSQLLLAVVERLNQSNPIFQPDIDPPSIVAASPTTGPRDNTSCTRDVTHDSSRASSLLSTIAWDDEQGWSVALKQSLKNLQERVRLWKDGLDTTLLFVALFSAIVTAFLLQTIQNLSLSTDQQNTQEMLTILINATVAIAAMNGMNVPDITFPGSFQAARSDEISASVWYTSLFTSIVCAALAAFARYQMPDIEDLSSEFGQRFLTKVLTIRERTTLGKRLLKPTLKFVHWTLIGSIVLFGAGLIYQLWISVVQSGGRSSGLFIASVVSV
ncbi:hypothetical protein SISNIDRAFT_495378 [Sistotremastrum niveocremeum HHB9708]|uniref:DUF6535 domain-containing protein n=1 Tax=Sistotremastrum niveocremeum HHB9708 TaxID=1314777 RepID=A0A164V4R7_9AGAM|nr:hypothetical protein SISNIDRAFT_495378 [Sistotremastrum niveocremeum HHB9708]